jgi:type II secretory pathway pseudopilin PulG
MQFDTRKGFTLIEVLVVAPIVILVVGTFIAAMTYLTGDALQESARVRMMNDTHAALERIENDVRLSGAFLSVNNMALTSPQGFNDATQNFTNVGLPTGGALVLNTFVTDRNPLTAGKNMVFLANAPNACGSGTFYQNQIMTMNTVYFVKNNTLWKRTLATNGYDTKDCAGITPWQRPSCSPGVSGTLCLSQDEAILSVSDQGSLSMLTDYYTTASSTTEVAGATTGTDSARQSSLNSTNTVRITLRVTDRVAGQDISQQAYVRATRPGLLATYATPL